MKSLLDKFKYAIHGIILGVGDHAIRIQCFFFVVAILLSFIFKLNAIEWCIILLSCALVLLSEFVNTAIERIMDFVQPEYDERVKYIKDLAAGFVLLVSIIVLVIGIIIFGGKLL